jgi:hypothetical protein
MEEFYRTLLQKFDVPEYMSGNIDSVLAYLRSIAKIRVGRLIFYNEIPNLEVLYTIKGREGEEGIQDVIGYLQPFRGYKFQVSGTITGQGDLGSCQVFGLGNIVDAYIPVKGGSNGSKYASNVRKLNKYILELAAKEALHDLARSSYGNGASVYVKFEEYDRFLEFIEKVMDWLK